MGSKPGAAGTGGRCFFDFHDDERLKRQTARLASRQNGPGTLA
jgi:hypothetical protein